MELNYTLAIEDGNVSCSGQETLRMCQLVTEREKSRPVPMALNALFVFGLLGKDRYPIRGSK